MTQAPIPEDLSRLRFANHARATATTVQFVVETLEDDCVAIVRDISAQDAGQVLSGLARRFDLLQSLQLQAGFAEFQGHRKNVGNYFMSVNARADYQFITPHSEGDSFTALQIAAFYCLENTTDGGETILMSVNGSSDAWPLLKEQRARARVGKALSRGEIAQARGLYSLRFPDDLVQSNDEVFGEHPTRIPGLTVLDVLTAPKKTACRILQRDVYGYWDSIASIDYANAKEYLELLRGSQLLREPLAGMTPAEMDNASSRRRWDSKVDYSRIFNSRLTCKLRSGELVISNNLTWAHSASNWTPGSGSRRVVAAFA